MVFRSVCVVLALLALVSCRANVHRMGGVSATAPMEFDPSLSYAVVELKTLKSSAGVHQFCKLSPDGTYRVANGNFSFCVDGGAVFGDAGRDVGDIDNKAFTLSDGRIVQLMQINTPSTLRTDPVLPGAHVLAGYVRPMPDERGRSRVRYRAPVPVYALKPGHVHYLGLSELNKHVEWAEPRGIAALLSEAVPGLPAERIVADPPTKVYHGACDGQFRKVCGTRPIAGQ